MIHRIRTGRFTAIRAGALSGDVCLSGGPGRLRLANPGLAGVPMSAGKAYGPICCRMGVFRAVVESPGPLITVNNRCRAARGTESGNSEGDPGK
jgi:hypothetical protein